MQSIKLFILASIKELREKVTWPSYKSLQDSTVLILISALLLSVSLGFLDAFFKKVVSYIYNFFG